MRGEDLDELAHLARLELPAAAAEQTRAQIERLLRHFAALQAVDTELVEPSAYPLPIPHRPRPDVTEPPLTQEEVLANAPASRGGCFLVPRVVEG